MIPFVDTRSDSFTTPAQGNATLTHYDLPFDYVASCGCVGLSTRYPTAAINDLAYGSSNSYGPACGQCYRLTLISTPFSPPPPEGNGVVFNSFADDTSDKPTAPTVVVKVTDACPLGGEWCSQTVQKPTNSLNSSIHFDLAWPSTALSKDFFPTDGGRDYGAWWTEFAVVDCQEWAGYDDVEAWGSDWSQQSSACCPLRPHQSDDSGVKSSTISDRRSTPIDFDSYDVEANEKICPSYSEQIALKLSYDDMIAQVPNTSNVASRKEEGIGLANGAWSFYQGAFFWSDRNIDREAKVYLEDWQGIVGPRPVPS
ncbi:hypothetical protein CBS101457_006800 [Exobasidium rhododendri]|nr:hypothetical protein CBS101457_006800 [Exobasidium rhododendri]